MQLLILSLLIAVASATYPSYYSGYGGYGGYGSYGSSLYGHSYGGSSGLSYVLGDHSSDIAYSHAPRYFEGFSKTNILSSNGGTSKIHFVKGVDAAKVDTSSVESSRKDPMPDFPKPSKNVTDVDTSSEDDWVDITSEDNKGENGTQNEEKHIVDDTESKDFDMNENNKGSTTKKESSNPVHDISEESIPSFDSFENTSDTTSEPEIDTEVSHEPVHEVIKSPADESELNIPEKLTVPDDNNNKKAGSKNKFVPIPDQDYDDFGSKMDEVEKVKHPFVKQSSLQSVKGGKSSAALYSLGMSPTLIRPPRKTGNFENSALSRLVSTSDIASFEAVDVPLPYYYYKQNQRAELYEHVPTFEYIPNIANY